MFEKSLFWFLLKIKSYFIDIDVLFTSNMTFATNWNKLLSNESKKKNWFAVFGKGGTSTGERPKEAYIMEKKIVGEKEPKKTSHEKWHEKKRMEMWINIWMKKLSSSTEFSTVTISNREQFLYHNFSEFQC